MKKWQENSGKKSRPSQRHHKENNIKEKEMNRREKKGKNENCG